MIQLKQDSSNEFVIYANTISNSVEQFGDYFLIGFQNGFTKEWTYVVPYVLSRNSRYLKFQVSVVPSLPEEDPLNYSVYLSPSMNWDYKIWNLDYPTLLPDSGNLIDKGQMILENQEIPEVQFTAYVSPDDNLTSTVYYSNASELPNEPSFMQNMVIYADTITNDVDEFGNYFILGLQNAYSREWSYVIPTVLTRNTRYLEIEYEVVTNPDDADPLNSIVYLKPAINWNYKVWNTNVPTINYNNALLIDDGELVISNPSFKKEVTWTTYVSANDNLQSFVYYTSNNIWNNIAQLWEYDEIEWQNS